MKENDLFYLVAMSTTDVIGPRRYRKITEQGPGIEKFFEWNVSMQAEFLGIKNERIERLSQMQSKAEETIETCEKKNIKIITLNDSAYPPILKSIPDPPLCLYVRGTLNVSIPKVAVVGTRKTSAEAVSINEYFCKEFCDYQIGVVSGLAKGHDTVAAKAALEEDGYTIAVLGNGVDVVYPASNKTLYERIAEHGALVSEYPPGTHGDAWRFPQRNRIISGLSRAVLVIQAPQRSGALITAQFAEAQGRELYVIPGNPLDARYAGSNDLIQKGAKVALTPEDMLEDLTGKRKRVKRVLEIPGLSSEEKRILDSLSSETHIDELLRQTGKSAQDMNVMLTGLELRGLVRQYPGGFYIREIAT